MGKGFKCHAEELSVPSRSKDTVDIITVAVIRHQKIKKNTIAAVITIDLQD